MAGPLLPAVLNPAEYQKTRSALLACSLVVVTGAGEARPRIAPIVGALRHPLEMGRAHEPLQRPGRVIRDIGDKTKFTARAQNARQLPDPCILNEPALPMPPLRPGIRMNEIDPGERRIREPGDQVKRVIEMQTNILKAFGLDAGERLGHAIDERFDANKTDMPICFGFGEHRLTAAKADFETNRRDRFDKQRAELSWRRPTEIEGKTRQQRFEQPSLPRPQLMAFTASEERTDIVEWGIHSRPDRG